MASVSTHFLLFFYQYKMQLKSKVIYSINSVKESAIGAKKFPNNIYKTVCSVVTL